MSHKIQGWSILMALAVLISGGQPALADTKEAAKADAVELPKPNEVQALNVLPAKIDLKGGDDAKQLIITATLAGDRLQDLTGDIAYEVADNKVVRVTTTGRVVPIANG